MEKTAKKKSLIVSMLEQVPRVANQIRDPRTIYLGPCVVQSEGGWTRVGPTWVTQVGWVTIGPGVAQWGTTQGLAELATLNTAKPTWHSIGVGVSPRPNIAFADTVDALGSAYMVKIAELAEDAERFEADGRP